jgi:hypothetical protein
VKVPVGDRPDLEVIEAGEALLARAHQTAQAIAQRVCRAPGAEEMSGPHARGNAAAQGQDREGSVMLATATQQPQAPAREGLPRPGSWELASFAVRRADEAGAAAGAVAASMAAGYPDDVCGLRASLEAALRSAVRADPAREVCILYVVSPEETLAEVQDQGRDHARARPLTLRRRRSAT